MDPAACLRDADQAISDGDYQEAQHALNDYANWRARGGFEPIEVAGTLLRGDDFARECQRRLDEYERQKREDEARTTPAPRANGDGMLGYSEGWGVFETDSGKVEIQRIDETAVFDSDAAAVAYVKAMAQSGSTLHQRVIDLVLGE